MKVDPERTLVLIKPDGVQRGLIGRILTRFEEVGLKVIGLKMVTPTRAHVEQHYPNTPDWIMGMGNKTLKSYEENGVDAIAELGTKDPMQIGEMVKGWNIDYLASGSPIVAIVFEGYHAIQVVRKLCGHTLPLNADPGTIRGAFSSGSPIVANAKKHAIHNLIHASSTVEEANHEIAHWFPEGNLANYDRPDVSVIF